MEFKSKRPGQSAECDRTDWEHMHCFIWAGVALAYDMCLGHERTRLNRGEGTGFAAAEKELEIVEQL